MPSLCFRILRRRTGQPLGMNRQLPALSVEWFRPKIH